MSDTLKIANSIWPNGMKVDSDGHAVFYPLGTNKINVPTSLSEWPKGDKLISPFVYQDDKLVGFVDTKALITASQTAIYLPYEHIEAEFSAINKGRLQIHAPNATIKKASWKDSGKEDIPEAQYKYKGYTTTNDFFYENLADIANGTWTEPLWDLTDGSEMFEYCTNLTSFHVDLPSLTTGSGMFAGCTNLNSFNSDLSSLMGGSHMFEVCTNLTSFHVDLPSLMNSGYMFSGCTALTSFSSVLSSLTNGYYMFRGCINLTSFSSDLSSLTDGNEMFNGCSNLTSFYSNLSSLTNGYYMFMNCKLDTTSVQIIADTINTVTGGHEIGIGIGNSSPNVKETAAFNKMASKGWTVYVNGSQYTPTSPAAITTLDETGQEITTPIPFWAKPVQTDEEHAKYIDSEGNFYNILGGQFIYGDNLETYGMFTCEDDAAANMRLTPYTKPIEN